MRLDPVTIQILWNRVISVVDEAATGLVRAAYSSSVRDYNDYCCGVFDAKGNLLAHSTQTTTAFIGVIPQAMRNFLAHFPAQTLKPGDVLLTNDPWLATGHHYDISVATPIFHRGILQGFSLCVVHHLDIGGRMATTESRDTYEEGLKLPMMKYYEAGTVNRLIDAIIGANVRVPHKVLGDLRAQVAANNVCAKGLCALLDEYPEEGLFEELSGEIVARSEASLRRKIAALPDGTYGNEVELAPISGLSGIRIKVAVTVAGDEIIVDYTGSSGEVPIAINVVFNILRSYTTYPIKLALDPDVPNNDGCQRPIRIICPEGTLLNCKPPAPTWGRVIIGHQIPEIVFGALEAVLPDRIIAGCGATPMAANYVFTRRKDGRNFVGILSHMGGCGAGIDHDGQSCLGFPYNVGNVPIEFTENEAAIFYERKELLTDSAGAGRFRGGLGQEVRFRVADGGLGPVGPVLASFRGSGRTEDSPFPIAGLQGGRPGRGAHFTINGKPFVDATQQRLHPGDEVVMRLPGGGGHGDPRLRPAADVARDVRLGYVSPEAARDEYGVAIDPATGAVDETETARLRGAAA